ncbi:MAG: VWA domain-containing protein [Clostridia bacterium]|nr:VWA domain-containing protein [Clostridia bacterium]
MSFLYPLGLLGLIGIPILIIIYIIKSKYTEQTVSSTYLWTLSERFLKRKNPISRLTGIISLVLQILAIALISLAIAHPIITVPDLADEYCFILDASGSMNMTSGDKTRFERGKERIAEIIDDSVDGSIYSLVYVGNTTNAVFEQISDKEQAKLLLTETEPVYNAADFTDAIGMAQGYFDKNSGMQTYLVTDKSYQNHENVTVINVAGSENNYGISGVTYTVKDNRLTVNGQVTSYQKDASLGVELYVDDGAEAKANGTIVARAGVPTAFQLTCAIGKFSSLKVSVSNADALAYDNEYVIFDVTSESSYDTLLVSDTPFFLQSALETLMNARLDVVSTKAYAGQSGYGLYVFDCFTPEALPKDGTVWLVNPTQSVSESGFSVQGEVSLEAAEKLVLEESSSSTMTKLTADMAREDVYVMKYVKCGLYRNFTTVYSYNRNPVLFAGTNGYGNREVVFAFDLHDSNLPVLFDYAVIMRNLIEYSFPEVVERTDYYCGDTVDINVPANCESIRIDSPNENVSYLNTDNATCTLKLDEVGVYTVTMTVGSSQRSFNIYASMPEEERIPTLVETEICLLGNATDGGFDGVFDPLMILFIALAVIFLADWGVYCYEKYQLR